MLTTNPKKVLNANPKRVNLKIYNTDSQDVYLLAKETDDKTSGYPIPSGKPYENEHHQGDVILVSNAGDRTVYIEVEVSK